MKQLMYPTIGQPAANFFVNKVQVNRSRFKSDRKKVQSENSRVFQLLTPAVKEEIANGIFPDLEKVCYNLIDTFRINNFPFKAVQFLEVLKNVYLTKSDVNQLVNHRAKKHILVENELIKIVLIFWQPNDLASVHGHPTGGCVLKVLEGKLVEKRYSADDRLRLLSKSTYTKSAMAYIDDTMALHSVANPFKKHAISLHVYTPGGKS